MANGTDSEEFVLCSRVRAGLKREFAFALKVQAEMCGSLGRTRARRPLNGGLVRGGSRNSSNKRLKSSGSKGVTNEAKNDEGDALVEDQTTAEAEKERSEVTPSRDGSLLNNEAAKSDFVSKDEKASLIVVPNLDCVSEEEPKSDVVDMTSDDEPKSHLEESASKEELNKDSICEESKRDLVESMTDELMNSHIVESAREHGHTNDSVNPMCAQEPVADHAYEGVPVLVDDSVNMENSLVGKPLKRFTRSALKPNVMPVEVPAVQNGVKNMEILHSDDGKASNMSSAKSKTVKSRKIPLKLRDLLSTGILEGLSVTYLRGLRVRTPNETGLQGVIKGCGILCHCSTCKGITVVTPNQFELHAGSSNKRPPEYIYLENGNTLRDVLNACKGVPLDAVETSIKNAIGCPSHSTVCLNCKGSISKAVAGDPSVLCESCLESKESQATPTITTDPTDRLLNSDLSSETSHIMLKSSSVRSKSQGRLTRKDLRLHKLVFQEDILPDGTEVAYYARGQKLLIGYKKGFGIFCTCCNSEVSPSQFEAHAGWASRRKPYLHIYTSNGVSLHELSVSLSRGRMFSTNDNDDLCTICADGGDLLCCDGCPRAFHKECISLSSCPGDTWFCKYCETMFLKERFVERNANAMAAGRIAGVDPIEQITKRCIRIAKTPGEEFGGCAFCRGHDFSKSGFSSRTVILCDQCEKEYHVGCLKEHNMADLKELPEGQWFCNVACSAVHSALQKLVDNGVEELSDSLLNVLKKKHEQKDPESSLSLDIKWRVVKGKMASGEMRPLLSKAVAIFHEQFDPILELGTNRDYIPNMVYGRNMRDHEFGNMFCAVLTVNSAVVSAGLFRIFGKEAAELPLVATCGEFQGQGYFQCLFSCIERLLGSLEVKKFLLPAADEAESIWTKRFGFNKVTQDELDTYKKNHPMMTFQGTTMLHKLVPEN